MARKGMGKQLPGPPAGAIVPLALWATEQLQLLQPEAPPGLLLEQTSRKVSVNN